MVKTVGVCGNKLAVPGNTCIGAAAGAAAGGAVTAPLPHDAINDAVNKATNVVTTLRSRAEGLPKYLLFVKTESFYPTGFA